MPKAIQRNIACTHVLGDTVYTDEQWYAAKHVIDYSLNRDIIDDLARKLDPQYRALENAKGRVERIERRRQALQSEAARIDEQINRIK